MGLALLGENLTQLTQSEWPSSLMVYLHWARVFHSLMVLSLLADTICLLSAEKATDITSLVWSSRCSSPRDGGSCPRSQREQSVHQRRGQRRRRNGHGRDVSSGELRSFRPRPC